MNKNPGVGKNIKRQRAFKGIKQSHLAENIGVSRVTLSKYENGKVDISLGQLKLIVENLEIDFNHLFL